MKYRLFAIIPAYLLLYFGSFAMAFGLRFDFQTARFIDSFWATVPIALCARNLAACCWSEWRRQLPVSDRLRHRAGRLLRRHDGLLLAAINLLVPPRPTSRGP